MCDHFKNWAFYTKALVCFDFDLNFVKPDNQNMHIIRVIALFACENQRPITK